MMRWFILLGFIAVLPTVTHANVTAGQLNDYCKDTEGRVNQGMCLGYISGWADQYSSFPLHEPGKVVRPEFKDGVTTGQLMRVFLKYIKEHPEEENHDANWVLIDACAAAKLVDIVPL
jgi:hypothetical protein